MTGKAAATKKRRGLPRLRSRAEFARFVARFLAIAFAILMALLGVGVAGYHWIAGLGWIEAFLNASMTLTGMGLTEPLPTDEAKLFASVYALLSGGIYPVLTAVVLYPFVHRMLHALHLDALDGRDEGG